MAFENNEDLLRALLVATDSNSVRKILDEIGDHANVELDEPFAPFGFCWHAYGDNESNLSSIGLGTNPGRSLTERLTNAIDAIIEEQEAGGSCSSPVCPARRSRLGSDDQSPAPITVCISGHTLTMAMTAESLSF